MTQVLLTIDTELAWRHFAAGHGWEENYRRSCEPAGVGLGYQLDTLKRHKLKACFFVDPMPACRYGLEPVRRMVETVLAAGQEVQLHLHPSWEGESPVFELTGLSVAEQSRLLETGRRLLVEAGAPEPVAFRAGSFGADDATLDALAAMGIAYDSSFNGGHAPWPSAISLPARQVDPVRHCGVIELPVSQMEDRAGSMRHLQLCAVSSAEIEQALEHAHRVGQQVATIVSHSFELATRDGLRANGLLKARWDRLCAWLGNRRETLPTAHFTGLPALRMDESCAMLAPDPWRTFGRKAQQALGNLIYERRL
jgi:hypothetical protein